MLLVAYPKKAEAGKETKFEFEYVVKAFVEKKEEPTAEPVVVKPKCKCGPLI